MMMKKVVVGCFGFVLILCSGWVQLAATETEAGQINPTEIQKALSEAGFYKGSIDGVIGKKTKAAVKSFQEANGLKVDGVVGPKTWEKLKAYLEEANEIDSNVAESETQTETLEEAPLETSPTLDESTDYSYSEFGTEPTEEETSDELKQKLVS